MAEKKTKKKYIPGLGRRKTAVAQVRLFSSGSGKVTVNERDLKDYFPTLQQQQALLEPLTALGYEKKYDLVINTRGGGLTAQSEAAKLGIARALLKEDEEVKATLKKHDLLTRDSRKKERKKPGLKGARRAPQWQKR